MVKRTKKTDGIDVNVERTPEQFQLALLRKVKIFYDLQRMRLQAQGRITRKGKDNEVILHEVDKAIMSNRVADLESAEKAALSDVEDQLKLDPFYRDVLTDKSLYRGVGPTMAGVILSSFDIQHADTPSKFWAFAGLAPIAARRCKTCSSVVEQPAEVGYYFHPIPKPFKPRPMQADAPPPKARAKCAHEGQSIAEADTFASGEAMRPTKGEKLPYNAFLKTKLVGVLGPVLLQLGAYRCRACNALAKKIKVEGANGEQLFEHREGTCEKGNGLSLADVVFTDRPRWVKHYEDYKLRKQSAGWGRSDAHRHQAAIRYMIKMLLADVWRDWRTYLKLSVRDPYAVEKLGKPAHVGGTLQNNALPFVTETEAEITAEVARASEAQAVTGESPTQP